MNRRKMQNTLFLPAASANVKAENQLGPYSQTYSGAINLLQDAGFSPYKFDSQSPLDSTLYEVFNEFISKTGMGSDAEQLKDEFLTENPKVESAISLYNSLEKTFNVQYNRDKAAIVDFINEEIDTFFEQRNSDDNKSLSRVESGIPTSTFIDIDDNGDWEINKFETRRNFYEDNEPVNNVLNYFQENPGSILDTYT